VRVATWNGERGRFSDQVVAAQGRVLERVAADVVVITEPSAAWTSGQHGRVISERRRAGRAGAESWVAISGHEVRDAGLAIPFERLACAAVVGAGAEEMAVYGSVLPWLAMCHQAPDLSRPGETALDAFTRVLFEQANDVRTLQAQFANVVWCGDFNQSLAGPTWGGSRARRGLLADVLADLGLQCWNATERHAREGMCAVDLICGSKHVTPTFVGRFEPDDGGFRLSDHAGYWVDL
jgi:hypothetical protein